MRTCMICGEPAVEIVVYLQSGGIATFCKDCLLVLPGAITEALAEGHPELP